MNCNHVCIAVGTFLGVMLWKEMLIGIRIIIDEIFFFSIHPLETIKRFIKKG